MLTYGDLKNHVLLAIGGRPSTAAGQTVAQRQAEIINISGEHLFTHPWRFRERTDVVATVPAQSWVALPAAFSELTQVWRQNQQVVVLSPEQVETARASNFNDRTLMAYVRVVVPTNAAPTQTHRLELYPTPIAAENLKVLFRAGWVFVAHDTANDYVVSIPQHVEATLIAYVRAVAEGYEDGSQSQRFAEIEAGPIFGAAKQKDGMIQSNFGPVQPNTWRGNSRSGPGFTIFNPVQGPS
jgi:hypothetical protein